MLLNIHGGTVKIDKSDLLLVSPYKWHVNSTGYAVCNIYTGMKEGKQTSKTLLMHRVLLAAPKGMEVDHINENKLDNRRKNIRICTKSQNSLNKGLSQRNTSGFIGVSLFRQTNRYSSSVTVSGRKKHLGYYKTAVEAARIYDKAAKQFYGEFARLNNV